MFSRYEFRLMLMGAALPLLVLLAAPVSANASCGDYVLQGDRSLSMLHSSTDAPTPDVPCHGPMCSRQNPPLVPPTPIATSSTRDDCFCSPMISPNQSDSPFGRVDPIDHLARPRTANPIFHPPRRESR